MIHFLASLSIVGVVIALIFVMMLGPVLELLLRKKIRPSWFQADEAVVNYVQMLTVFYGLLLGLVAIDLWQKQDAAESNTVNETNQIRIVYALSSYLPGDKQTVNDSLADYTQGVIKKEWPIMLRGHTEELFVASPELDLVRDSIMSLGPKTAVEQATFQEILTRYSQIVQARQQRLLDSERKLPAVLWMALLLGAIFTWTATSFVPSKFLHSQLILSSITSGYLFLLMYLIIDLERPFIGAWRVDPTPYIRVLDILH